MRHILQAEAAGNTRKEATNTTHHRRNRVSINLVDLFDSRTATGRLSPAHVGPGGTSACGVLSLLIELRHDRVGNTLELFLFRFEFLLGGVRMIEFGLVEPLFGVLHGVL